MQSRLAFLNKPLEAHSIEGAPVATKGDKHRRRDGSPTEFEALEVGISQLGRAEESRTLAVTGRT